MKKIFLSFFIVISLLFFNTTVVNACSCIQPASPQVSLEKSTAVFAGKVVDINAPILSFSSANLIKVTFEVSKIWKGADYKTIVLTTARSSASCGFSFKQSEGYIVYASGEENKLSVSLCSRTILLASAQDDLQELGKGKLPTNPNSNNKPLTSDQVLIISIIGIVIILISAVILFIRKHKK